MKTGYTDDAGYGLVASAERGGQRLVMVITGLDSPKARGVEGQKLLEYGFRTFKEYRLFEPGKPVAEVPVWLGERATVPLVGEDPISVTLPRAARDGLKATVAFEAPVPAPIGAGQRLGRILVTAPGMEDMEIPLVAGEAVPRAGIVGRMTSALSYLVWGGGGNIAPAGAEPATASAR